MEEYVIGPKLKPVIKQKKNLVEVWKQDNHVTDNGGLEINSTWITIIVEVEPLVICMIDKEKVGVGLHVKIAGGRVMWCRD